MDNKAISTIMVVDNTPANLKILQDMLQDSGYRVLAFPSGRMALAAAVKNPPDLILLDIMMPEMNGFEVCERLKADPVLKDIPVLFISALTETTDKVRAFSVGGVDYVTKPFQFEEVRARVKTHLNLRRMQMELERHNLHLEDVVEKKVWEVRAAEKTLHESRERFEALVNRLKDAIWTADMNASRILEVNQAFEDVYGLPGEALRANPNLWLEMVHSEDREIARAGLKDLMENGIAQAEYRIVRPDGDVRWIKDRKSLLLNEGHYPAQMGCIVNDITESKNEAAEKEKLKAAFLQAQKMEAVGHLAGGVAHDFNNMLSVILGFTQMALDRTELSSDLHEDLKEVLDAAGRSADITRQLLTFARKQIAAPVVLDLNEAVGGMLRMLRRLIGESIHLDWIPAGKIWPVKIDPSQVDQILANLCVNARDAIGGVGKLTIETHTVTFDEAYCHQHHGFIPGAFTLLAVSDNGCGMDKNTLEHIFEPFFTTKEPGRGTGLGLSTIYGIVKQNNGFINVYSEPGQGTTFKIYLPHHGGDVDLIKGKDTVKIPAGRRETVLIVEDETSILKLVKKMLEELDYTVLTADTPSGALRMAEAYPDKIHLLITDVVMSEMNGRELAERFHVLHPGHKTLFMSGYTANVIAHHGILEPGIHFLQKPFSQQGLAFKVREALEAIGKNN